MASTWGSTRARRWKPRSWPISWAPTGTTAPGFARRCTWKCADACWSNRRAKSSTSISGRWPKRRKLPGLQRRKAVLMSRENADKNAGTRAPQPPAGGQGRRAEWFCRGLVLVSSLLLLTSLRLPLWRMHLEAPQYRDREALNIAVHPDRFQGDLKELTVLDQYIGVHVPASLPQFKWLPALLAAVAGLGVVAAFLNGARRRRGLVVLAC